MPSQSFDIVIIGGGAAGIAVAASLLRRTKDLSIAIIEPADTHSYQPAGPSWAQVYLSLTRQSAPWLMLCPWDANGFSKPWLTSNPNKI